MKTLKTFTLIAVFAAYFAPPTVFAGEGHKPPPPPPTPEVRLLQRFEIAPVQKFEPVVKNNTEVRTGDNVLKSGPINVEVEGSRASSTVGDITAAGGAGGRGGQGGQGGEGGRGGQSSSDAAAKAEAEAKATAEAAAAADASGVGVGEATITDSGNGGGATVETTNTNKFLNFVPVQVASLPPTIVSGGVSLTKVSECGPLVIVNPFKRTTRIPQIFGLWNSKIPVETMHGTFGGFDPERDFVIVTSDIPAPFNEKIVKVYGHQLYLTVGQDGQGGGSSGALNRVIDDRGTGGGASLSAGSVLGIVGVVAVPCEYEVQKASTALATPLQSEQMVPPVVPPASTYELNAQKTQVLAPTGKWSLERKPTGPELCAGQPIPEGSRCVFTRDRVSVVEDVDLLDEK